MGQSILCYGEGKLPCHIKACTIQFYKTNRNNAAIFGIKMCTDCRVFESQKEGEFIAAYAAGVKKIAEHWNFGIERNEGLKVEVVCDILKDNVEKTLLT